jgi:hypothetical protein
VCGRVDDEPVPSVETEPQRPYPREFCLAGTLLVAAGTLWLLCGVGIAAWFFEFTPVQSEGAHGMGSSSLPSVALGVLSAIYTVPAFGLLALGFALRARKRTTPRFALVLAIAAFALVTQAVAFFGGPLEPGAPGRWALGITALSLTGGMVLLLARGFAHPFPAHVSRESTPYRGPSPGAPANPGPIHPWVRAARARFLPGRSVYVLLLFGAALGLILAGQIFRGRVLLTTDQDQRPVNVRSDLTLALQATGSPQLTADPARAELLRRGAHAAPAIVGALKACPMTMSELNRRSGGGSLSQMCTDWRVPGVLGLLADLRGPDAVAELRRWLRSDHADPLLRDQAAYALARAGDRDSLTDIAGLLDVADRPDENGMIKRRRDLVMQGLVLLRATEQVPRIVSTLRRLGPHDQCAHDGLRALGDLDTPESWDAFREFGRSPEIEWRHVALGAYATHASGATSTTALPRPFVDLCLERLDDPDPATQVAVCYALLPGDWKERHERYWAALRRDPCMIPVAIGLIRDVAAGRPLPAPSAPQGFEGAALPVRPQGATRGAVRRP